MNNDTSPPLESVDRALQLAILLRDAGPLTVKAAAERLNVVPSTAHRLLAALVHRGFAVQDRDRRYHAGPAWGVGGQLGLSEAALRDLARPSLQLLQQRVQETAQVMELQGVNIRFIDGIECQAPLRVGVRIGVGMPAHCSAGGKALLAALCPDDLKRLYRDGLPPWPTARYTTVEALTRHLSTVRRLGYGTNLEETEPGVSGVGVTVPSPDGCTRLAFTVAVPTARFDRADVQRYVNALNAVATDLAARLSGRAAAPWSG
ncbi:IclR family transcriptional regulator [Micromonospora globispora]|uniref:IclR family transcriptional regulator n=1 Tax=Micromonospora globispora TaxID=1450148 RepID=UPI000D6ED2AF|nr:IclR family transcriptional regulator [Micromonospora globispora]PWU55439.1 IclR family transcriptional regulator [Micromonospora globispora]RQW91838.1 IclR family transcriptional regulator [Micromonospora globispora]